MPDAGRPEKPAEAAADLGARRTSIFVGLAFVALVADRRHQHAAHQRRGSARASARPAPLAAARVRGPRCAAARSTGTPTSPRTTARPRPALPGRRPPHPGLRDRPRGRDPRLRLFDRPLVLSFWFTSGGDCEAEQDVFEGAYRRYRGRVNFLSLDVRDDRDTVRELIARARLDACRSARLRRRAPDLYRIGGCPTFLYVYPGGIAPDASIGELDLRGSSSAKVEALLADRPAEPSEPPGSRHAEVLPEEWESAPEPGWVAPVLDEEFPGPRRSSAPTVGRGSGRAREAVKAPAARDERPLRRRPGDPPARAADPLGLPGLLPPHRPRPRHAPAPRSRQLALKRMYDGGFKSKNRLDDALTIATMEIGVALRAFDADQVEGRLGIRHSAPGEKLRGPVGELAHGNPGDRRREAAGRGSLRRRPPRAGASTRRPSARCSPRSRSRACPRSPSKRRSGLLPAPCGRRLKSSGDDAASGGGAGRARARRRSPASARNRGNRDRRARRAQGAAAPDRPHGGRAGPPLRRGLPAHRDRMGRRRPRRSPRARRRRARSGPRRAGRAGSPRRVRSSPRSPRTSRLNRELSRTCSPTPPPTSGCASPASRLGEPGCRHWHCARAGACSACCWAGGGSRSPPVVR